MTAPVIRRSYHGDCCISTVFFIYWSYMPCIRKKLQMAGSCRLPFDTNLYKLYNINTYEKITVQKKCDSQSG